jgi:hypothetical protein
MAVTMRIKKVDEIPVEGWNDVLDYMKERFGRPSGLKEVLFAIGLREFGHKKKKFTKEEKQDLMNLAVCKAFSLDGFFEVSHLDGDGWPVWKQSKPMPPMKPVEQEAFIKQHVVRYFKEEGMLSPSQGL